MLRPLLLVCLLFLVSRALFVAAMGDVFLYGEELEKGFVARCITADLDVPYARLAYHPYEGGGFVASHVKAVAFALFGCNILAHKICAVFWGVLVLMATMGLLVAHGGGGRASKSSAILGGVLLTFGPAFLQRGSLLHLGIHFEALLFIALVLDLGLRVAAPERGERVRPGLYVCLGLAAGFGTYFSYQVPLAVLTVIGLLVVRAPSRIIAPQLVAATLVGLLPLAGMALHVGAEIVDLHGESIGPGGVGFLTSAARALSAPGAFTALGLGALAALAGSRAAPVDAARQRAAMTLCGFGVVWCVVAASTGLWRLERIHFHWFELLRTAPLVWSGIVLVALQAGPALALTAEDRGATAARVARSAATMLLGIGLIHTARIIDAGELERAGANLRQLGAVRGDDPRGAFVKIGPRLEEGRDTSDGTVEAEIVARFLPLESPPSPLLVTDLVAGVTQGTTATEDALRRALAPGLDGMPGGETAAILGLGAPIFHFGYPGRARAALEDSALDPRRAEALGRFGPGWFGATDLRAEMDTAKGAPQAAPYLRGVGARVFRTAVVQPFWGSDLVLRPGLVRGDMLQRAAELAPEEISALLAGFDAEARLFGFGDPTWPAVDSAR